jgi:putative nucleotidyltransferase with HDIG domain
MDIQQLLDLILKKATEVTPAPHLACKLLTLLKNPAANSVDEITNIIRVDPVMIGRVIKMSNSAFLGGSTPVCSVGEAITRIGYLEVMRVAVTLSASSTLAKSLPPYGVSSLEAWRHALLTALAAQRLVEETQIAGVDPLVAFTAGLLHDVGKSAISIAPQLDLAALKKAIAEGAKPFDAERAVLKFDHTIIGGGLLKNWKLPVEIVDAVLNHHRLPEPKAADYSMIVYVANHCAHVASPFAFETFKARIGPEIAEQLDLNADGMTNLHSCIHSLAARIEKGMDVS